MRAAVRSCSAAGDPWTERLRVSIDTRSLLMLLQAKLQGGAAGSPTKVLTPPQISSLTSQTVKCC